MEAQKVKFKTDSDGNALYAVGSTIYLKMVKDDAALRIGAFDLANKTLIINREYYDFNETYDCYPLNEAVLRAAKKCDTVTLTCPEGKFVIPINIALRYGTPLHHDTRDLSRQIFIKLSLIKNYAQS